MAIQPLAIRKLADRTDYSALDADLPGAPPGTWPLAGLAIEGETPVQTRVPTSFVARGRSEGWLSAEGESVVHRPGGPPEDKWRSTHTFVHYDAVVLKTVAGNVRYRVTHQPDKYADYGAATYPDRVKLFDADDATPVTDEIYASGATRVDWFYDLELEA